MSTYCPSLSEAAVQAWPFSGQLSSEPRSHRPTAPHSSDPAGPAMGSVQSVVYARFRSPISRVPFALNLLSRRGLLGCSLCSVHEANDSPIRNVIRRPRPYWRGSTVWTIGAIGRRTGPASLATFGGAPQIRRICMPLAFEISAAQDWLRAANRAMCVSLEWQIAHLGEDHMSLNADLNAAKYREKRS